MNGIVNVLKPPGMSSHDVVDRIRRIFGVKKAGHTGTLDPGAAGVLVVCLGVATRLARFLLGEDKEYRVEITFGMSTSTGDSYGEITDQRDASFLKEHDIIRVLPEFTGEVRQVPPMTSAIKWRGKKLYELAREGLVVERQERAVYIKSLEFIRGSGWGTPSPRALMHLSCSKGTYVRSLCHDMGSRLGCGAHMSFLVRTRAGPFKIADSVTLEELQAAASKGVLERKIIEMDRAVSEYPEVIVKSSAVKAVAAGSKLYIPGVARMPLDLDCGKLVRLTGPDGLLAIAEAGREPFDKEKLFFKPVCVLARQAGRSSN
ncbi:MAG: tRNA pseudouridine(55) synthase TruB [Pelotomaculum sp.]|uniref:tRNA pseudouridine synthase B n=1 Tax=Pelotomaculum thermopropionicum (strain DSM 13744 / JCM 10971 / SI) TaxID=370438 RepID=TRUB_PELTS|nr:RecName: Full=tRNA pseudouridine synthase B; AltName: Full=tRNA pseudouridine(55) synthase; Short=Psi55 synthase; AltName: Full=tRNA pseudouridylate synthase; AltName: Full=tRNA-uridine isomerase [Pelotomaculum thermopropionicum SI]NPV72243.1 tRNA pseudouridine(55) synthase TruB [Pelotomaculum sp.]BAF59453.1 pseudouridine synthase [Pelotomaculum thermopropionicum SI]